MPRNMDAIVIAFGFMPSFAAIHAPHVAYRAVKGEVYMFFRVHAFKRVAVGEFLFVGGLDHFFGYACYWRVLAFTADKIHFAMCGAASLRHGAKLGQSLKSMMLMSPCGEIMQSPP